MTAPKLVESIPTVTAPIIVPDAEPEMSRGRYLAGVITGGALLAIVIAGLFLAVVVTS